MTTTERFLLAMAIVFAIPYAVWRIGRTDYYAPLVVVQIVTGVLLGPGVFGAWFPEYHAAVFTPEVVRALDGVAWWGVIVFVWIAGIELDLKRAWLHRRESGVTAGLALGVPLAAGAVVAAVLAEGQGWVGPRARTWQFVLGVGTACAVTALPVLLLLMDKLDVLRRPLGQRILRYASMDDVAIWGVLALILTDWARVGRQLFFLAGFVIAAYGFRSVMARARELDRWHLGLVWLVACSFGADWSGLHYMVGAFLAGAIVDADAFGETQLDALRHHVLLVLMPVYFLSTGLRTNWTVGGSAVLLVAALFFVAQATGKLAGVAIAGRILGWDRGEASLVGWLLQAKGLISIVFASILLDRQIITSETFTALLLMAVASTMLTVPVVAPKLARMRDGLARAS